MLRRATLKNIAPLLYGAVALAACQKSRWADLRINAVAQVDGRTVRGSTLWSYRVINLPIAEHGSEKEVRGNALAIPISPGRYVYGLFRAIDGDILESFTLMTGEPGAFLRREEERHLPVRAPNTPSALADYVLDHMRGREFDFCLTQVKFPEPQSGCLVFVYFDDPNNLATVHMIRPHEPAIIGGHRVVIERISLELQEAGSVSGSSEADLPPKLRRQDNPVLGKLPVGIKTDGERQLYKQDFVRAK